MKNTFIILIALSLAIAASAQDIIEKNFTLDGISRVEFEMDLSDQIIIKTWDKQEVYIKAIVDINDNTDNDKYSLTSRESGDRLVIKAEIDDLESLGKSRSTHVRGVVVRDDEYCVQVEIDYEIFLPENLAIELETISGDIEVFGISGPAGIKTISGLIDLTVPASLNADFEISTVTGEIYSDLELETDRENKHMRAFLGADIEARLNRGGTEFRLETISGNVYLRKQ